MEYKFNVNVEFLRRSNFKETFSEKELKTAMMLLIGNCSLEKENLQQFEKTYQQHLLKELKNNSNVDEEVLKVRAKFED
jgi:hypothetical protein